MDLFILSPIAFLTVILFFLSIQELKEQVSIYLKPIKTVTVKGTLWDKSYQVKRKVSLISVIYSTTGIIVSVILFILGLATLIKSLIS